MSNQLLIVPTDPALTFESVLEQVSKLDLKVEVTYPNLGLVSVSGINPERLTILLGPGFLVAPTGP